jgi:hypothetical protein
MKIEDINLIKVEGGSISGAVINYLTVAVKTVYSIGQELGGAIRRIATKKLCPI